MSLISTDFAEKNLKEFKIIDASWHLPTENRDPYLEYKESHIPNSVFFDLDNTSEKNTDLPHMLPSEDQWSKSISKLGISNKDKILIYDNSRLYSACRCWFSLLYFGHDIGKLYILNGGLKKWKQENKALTDEKTNIVTSNYKAIKKENCEDTKEKNENYWGGQVIDCIGGARNPNSWTLFQVANIDNGEITIINADIVEKILKTSES